MALLRGGVPLWGDQGGLQDAPGRPGAPIDVPLAGGQRQPVAGACPQPGGTVGVSFNEPYRGQDRALFRFAPLGTGTLGPGSLPGALLLRLPEASLAPQAGGRRPVAGPPSTRSLHGQDRLPEFLPSVA